MSERIDKICHELFEQGKITFNEWIVISSGVTDYEPPECAPDKYAEAKQALLSEEVDNE